MRQFTQEERKWDETILWIERKGPQWLADEVRAMHDEIEWLQDEVASLADNRDCLEHDWHEQEKRIEELQTGNTLLVRAYNSATAKIEAALSLLTDEYLDPRGEISQRVRDRIEEALKGKEG